MRKCEYKFEDNFPETEKDFIEKLLVVEPAERLGSQESGKLILFYKIILM